MTYEILRVGLARGLYFWCIGNPREAGFQRGISPMVGDTACGREGRRDARPESLFWALARHLRAQNRDSGPKVGRRARDHTLARFVFKPNKTICLGTETSKKYIKTQ